MALHAARCILLFMYKHFFKRLIDFIIVLCVLLAIWPILFVITVWLHFANKGAGAFFLQERPGKDGKIFKTIKFKTMTDERDAEGNLFLTIRKVFMREDIAKDGMATTEAFNGHN